MLTPLSGLWLVATDFPKVGGVQRPLIQNTQLRKALILVIFKDNQVLWDNTTKQWGGPGQTELLKRVTDLVEGLENKSYEDRQGTGVIYSGVKEAEGRSHCFLQLPERRLQQGGCQSLFLSDKW